MILINDIVMPAFVSFIATGCTLWFKNYFDTKSNNFSFKEKFKDLIFKEKISAYKEISITSFNLIKILISTIYSKDFKPTDNKLQECKKSFDEYEIAISKNQFFFTDEVVNELNNLRQTIAKEILSYDSKLEKNAALEKLNKIRENTILKIQKEIHIKTLNEDIKQTLIYGVTPDAL
ncbi:MAG: hypothetical protein QMC67_05355 [Candidatus Wallbacteria bacterium]